MPAPSPVAVPAGFGTPGPRKVAVNGLVLGDIDEHGVRWKLTRFEGWGSPESTLELTQRARAHGATASESFLRSRAMELGGTVHAPSLAALDDAFDRLSTAASLSPFDLVVSEAGRVRSCRAQRSGAVIPKYHNDVLGEYSIILTAKDPRKYGDLQVISTALPSTSGGRTYPLTYPTTYTGVTNSGVIQVNNAGNEQAPVWLRVDGPIPAGGWSVTHLGSRRQLVFATSLALGAGEFVTVDMERREVLAMGQSARSGWVTSRGWFALDPGVNEIAFSAAGYDPGALLTVTTMSAWS